MMAERHTTPAPLRTLRLLPGDTAATCASAGPDTAADTQGDTRPTVVPGAEVVPLSPAERARLAVTRRAGTVADAAAAVA